MANEFDFFDNESTANTGSQSSVDPRLILIKVIRNWPIFIVTVFLGLLVAFIYHRYTNERFRLSSTLLIPDTNPNIDPSIMQFFASSNTSQFLNELEILKSERMTGLALDTLDFDVQYYSVGRIKTIEEYNSLPFEVVPLEGKNQAYEVPFTVEFVEGNNFKIYKTNSDNPSQELFQPYQDVVTDNLAVRLEFTSSRDLSGKVYNFTLRSRDKLIDEWSNRLRVTYQGEFTSIAALSLNYTNPRKGADFLNALMYAYMSQELDRKNQAAEKTINYVNSQMAALQDTLSIYASQMDEVKIENRVSAIDNVGSNIISEISKLEAQKRINELTVRNLEDNLRLLNQRDSIDQISFSVSPSLQAELDRYVSQLQEKYATRQEKAEVLSERTATISSLDNEID
ncbi:MAG: hypothetical protein JJ909_18855, partial [Roseivirga sp.]|nr:hypothetical protein [Roseivirga sp.]